MIHENEIPATTEIHSPERKAGSFGSIGTLILGMIIGGALVVGLGNVGAGNVGLGNVGSGRKESSTADALRQAAYEGARAGAKEAAGAAAAAPAAPVAVGPTAESVFQVEHRRANTLGSANAPVVIVEYSDFECGYCKRFFDTTLTQIIDTYVKDGKVQLSYKHFPFLADSSLPKAVVAECAAQQGKFWEMHNALFSGRIPAKFTACLKDDVVRKRVLADSDEGQRVGVRGTPSFLVNGKLLVGAQPYAAFRIAIEQAIKN
ncbi:MAG: thioredoxin domain-containing protein [Chloroflexi bacterium]|nr:thioredoxin domain-containing protein [Chloroflexota bacterium]